MTKVKYTCNYCGHSWEKEIATYYYDPPDVKCPKCKDTNIDSKNLDVDSGDIFGYNSDKPKKDAYIKKGRK
jgi:DNA replicative helicase MCM subunit Mcm2 (Cdc46/Mcm family)